MKEFENDIKKILKTPTGPRRRFLEETLSHKLRLATLREIETAINNLKRSR